MKPTRGLREKSRLLPVAQAVALELKRRAEGTRLRIRIPNTIVATGNTDGWCVVLGRLGRQGPRLEIWFDRISGLPDRKFYAGFCSDRRKIAALIERTSRKLWPVRTVGLDDTTEEDYLVFNETLKQAEFNAPILEKYAYGNTFYGIYDPSRKSSDRVNPHLVARAAAFFEDVARCMPRATSAGEQAEVYPQSENRKRVVSHLQRERSRLLAAECKIRDGYQCRVCGFRFEKRYGTLGAEFAEAHHLIPLGKLRGQTRTRLEDLATVCANCHRMLHRMEGKRGDLRRLINLVRNHRGNRK